MFLLFAKKAGVGQSILAMSSACRSTTDGPMMAVVKEAKWLLEIVISGEIKRALATLSTAHNILLFLLRRMYSEEEEEEKATVSKDVWNKRGGGGDKSSKISMQALLDAFSSAFDRRDKNRRTSLVFISNLDDFSPPLSIRTRDVNYVLNKAHGSSLAVLSKPVIRFFRPFRVTTTCQTGKQTMFLSEQCAWWWQDVIIVSQLLHENLQSPYVVTSAGISRIISARPVRNIVDWLTFENERCASR